MIIPKWIQEKIYDIRFADLEKSKYETQVELNDSIVTVGEFASRSKSNIKFLHFGETFPTQQKENGENGQVETVTIFPQIAMKFKDIVLIPKSKDFYVH